MNKHPYRLLIVALLLGLAFDFLFWDKAVGVNFALYVAFCLVGGVLLLVSGGLKPARQTLWLIPAVLFFAALTFLRQEPMTVFLAYLFTLVLLGVLAVTYQGGRWTQYSLLDYCYQFLQLFGSLLTRPLFFFPPVFKEQAQNRQTQKALSILPVFRGLVIALPVVIVFAALLSSADVVFNQKLVEFTRQFSFDNIFENFFRLILILTFAYGLAGAFLHAAFKSRDEKLLGGEKPIIKQFLGFTEAAIVLGSVAALFLVFVIIQFRYFFGGEVNIGVEGYTYSQYARSGFNELVTVAFLSLLLTLGLSTITNRENPVQRHTYSALSAGILALVLVILVSAYQRLALAIDWHGFSRLRLYPRVFLIWVGILFVAVVVLEILHRERHFAFAAMLASLGFAVTLGVINVDAAIVQHNVYRATLGRHFNVNYLASLTLDAVPALADEYNDTSLSVEVREGVGAALLCYYHSGTFPLDLSDVDWRSYSYSRTTASQAMAEVFPKLRGYQVNIERPLIRVRTPGSDWYECGSCYDRSEDCE